MRRSRPPDPPRRARPTLLPVFEPSPVAGPELAREFQEAHATWLGLVDMSWFVTLTFDRTGRTSDGRRKGTFQLRPMSLDRAYFLAIRWVRAVERSAVRGRARRRGLPRILVVERHRDGSPHVHVLIGGAAHLKAGDLESCWREGFAQVRRFDRDRHALPYLLKDLDVGAHFAYSWNTVPGACPRPKAND